MNVTSVILCGRAMEGLNVCSWWLLLDVFLYQYMGFVMIYLQIKKSRQIKIESGSLLELF